MSRVVIALNIAHGAVFSIAAITGLFLYAMSLLYDKPSQTIHFLACLDLYVHVFIATSFLIAYSFFRYRTYKTHLVTPVWYVLFAIWLYVDGEDDEYFVPEIIPC